MAETLQDNIAALETALELTQAEAPTAGAQDIREYRLGAALAQARLAVQDELNRPEIRAMTGMPRFLPSSRHNENMMKGIETLQDRLGNDFQSAVPEIAAFLTFYNSIDKESMEIADSTLENNSRRFLDILHRGFMNGQGNPGDPIIPKPTDTDTAVRSLYSLRIANSWLESREFNDLDKRLREGGITSEERLFAANFMPYVAPSLEITDRETDYQLNTQDMENLGVFLADEMSKRDDIIWQPVDVDLTGERFISVLQTVANDDLSSDALKDLLSDIENDAVRAELENLAFSEETPQQLLAAAELQKFVLAAQMEHPSDESEALNAFSAEYFKRPLHDINFHTQLTDPVLTLSYRETLFGIGDALYGALENAESPLSVYLTMTTEKTAEELQAALSSPEFFDPANENTRQIFEKMRDAQAGAMGANELVLSEAQLGLITTTLELSDRQISALVHQPVLDIKAALSQQIETRGDVQAPEFDPASPEVSSNFAVALHGEVARMQQEIMQHSMELTAGRVGSESAQEAGIPDILTSMGWDGNSDPALFFEAFPVTGRLDDMESEMQLYSTQAFYGELVPAMLDADIISAYHPLARNAQFYSEIEKGIFMLSPADMPALNTGFLRGDIALAYPALLETMAFIDQNKERINAAIPEGSELKIEQDLDTETPDLSDSNVLRAVIAADMYFGNAASTDPQNLDEDTIALTQNYLALRQNMGAIEPLISARTLALRFGPEELQNADDMEILEAADMLAFKMHVAALSNNPLLRIEGEYNPRSEAANEIGTITAQQTTNTIMAVQNWILDNPELLKELALPPEIVIRNAYGNLEAEGIDFSEAETIIAGNVLLALQEEGLLSDEDLEAVNLRISEEGLVAANPEGPMNAESMNNLIVQKISTTANERMRDHYASVATDARLEIMAQLGMVSPAQYATTQLDEFSVELADKLEATGRFDSTTANVVNAMQSALTFRLASGEADSLSNDGAYHLNAMLMQTQELISHSLNPDPDVAPQFAQFIAENNAEENSDTTPQEPAASTLVTERPQPESTQPSTGQETGAETSAIQENEPTDKNDQDLEAQAEPKEKALPDDISNRLMDFQNLFGIAVTGQYDTATQEALSNYLDDAYYGYMARNGGEIKPGDGHVYELKENGDIYKLEEADPENIGHVSDAANLHIVSHYILSQTLAMDETDDLWEGKKAREMERLQKEYLTDQSRFFENDDDAWSALHDIHGASTMQQARSILREHAGIKGQGPEFDTAFTQIWEMEQDRRNFISNPNSQEIIDNPGHETFIDFSKLMAANDIVHYFATQNTYGEPKFIDSRDDLKPVVPDTSGMAFDDLFFDRRVYEQLDRYNMVDAALIDPTRKGETMTRDEVAAIATERLREMAEHNNIPRGKVAEAMFAGRLNPDRFDLQLAFEGMGQAQQISLKEIDEKITASIANYTTSTLEQKNMFQAMIDGKDLGEINHSLTAQQINSLNENTNSLLRMREMRAPDVRNGRVAYDQIPPQNRTPWETNAYRAQSFADEFGRVGDIEKVETVINGERVMASANDIALHMLYHANDRDFVAKLGLKENEHLNYEDAREIVAQKNPGALSAFDREIEVMKNQSAYNALSLNTIQKDYALLRDKYIAAEKSEIGHHDISDFEMKVGFEQFPADLLSVSLSSPGATFQAGTPGVLEQVQAEAIAIAAVIPEEEFSEGQPVSPKLGFSQLS